MAAKPIMIQGTASGVGKTILTMALCRIFSQDGFKTAPFKAQNMTSNTAFLENGDEIAISQLLQANAAQTEPRALMNPLILKPLPESNLIQVILNGKPYGRMSSVEFMKIRTYFSKIISKSYSYLSGRNDIIVIEGAGSPAELNLNRDDIVNMGMAKLANAPVLLISDIDRGGVFASIYGTVNILDKQSRKYIKATAVNRFKGDISSFSEGAAILERITGLPVAGVIPYVRFSIPEEDALFDGRDKTEIQNVDQDSQFDLIAKTVRESLNMDLIYKIINDGMAECDE